MKNKKMKLSEITGWAGESADIPGYGSWKKSSYLFGKDSLEALAVAYYSGRPLLITGEPGVGKSRFAQAAAFVMGRHFMSEVIRPGMEAEDLLWRLDHTERLGQAQLLGALGKSGNTRRQEKSDDTGRQEDSEDTDLQEKLNARNFLSAGPLWWAIDWKRAAEVSKDRGYRPEAPGENDPEKTGVVLLIDENRQGGYRFAQRPVGGLGQSRISGTLSGSCRDTGRGRDAAADHRDHQQPNA